MTKKLPIEANEYHLIFKASSGRKESNATAGVCITHIEEILACAMPFSGITLNVTSLAREAAAAAAAVHAVGPHQTQAALAPPPVADSAGTCTIY